MIKMLISNDTWRLLRLNSSYLYRFVSFICLFSYLTFYNLSVKEDIEVLVF